MRLGGLNRHVCTQHACTALDMQVAVVMAHQLNSCWQWGIWWCATVRRGALAMLVKQNPPDEPEVLTSASLPCRAGLSERPVTPRQLHTHPDQDFSASVDVMTARQAQVLSDGSHLFGVYSGSELVVARSLFRDVKLPNPPPSRSGGGIG